MNLLKSLAAVSSMTMFSRVLGFARDAIVARVFGAGMATDAFFVAFKLPNLLRRIFAEGAFSQAFVPILAEYKSKQGEEATRVFVAYVSGLLTLALAIVTVAGMLAAPWVILVTAPGFADTADKFALTSQLLQITFPYILLISLASLAGAILNTWNRFSVPAFAPTFLNISMIGFALFGAPYFHPPVLALAWAVTVGGILQLVYQLPHLKKIGMLVLPRISFRDAGAMRVMKQMGPAILGVSVSQISLIINTIFASFLVSGSVSWMYYADRLMEFPSGVLGVALGTILLPSLSRSFASGNHDEYCRLMDWGLRLCFLLALPSAVALGILAKPLTVSLFQYGKFTPFDAQMTQRALIAYSVGLMGLIVVKVLAPGFYSRQDIKTPVRIAIVTLVMTQLMNLAFIGPLKHAGLSLSIGLAACLNASLLYWQLRKQNIFTPQAGWGRFLTRLFIAVIVMAAALLGMLYVMPDWAQGNMAHRLARLMVVVVVGVVAYFATLAVLGFRVKDFARRIA
ncbi:murein biosynthesis integral membrane protein MurJ [Phytobacter diazotrophicus]|jgi:putative peptidoglycan lipid II flippase|uniref:murein biosynthesis integral membrane protein MurJ n=1 Tax=Phytobacter diazotrophicus TaxID=395631 RepID=UPI0005A4B330|nr:murein biosynthesis integral membrane protein MurJ [Phytobacter diazotrophicus]AUU91642.1 murein biosynthesis integral membrane protein MurJ [Enterobacteriaceae bacterium ENNIH3]AUV08340.1 murein biosynthesis integral membrane protein MurJ [Enterobacteriaceae bacterium ENNIH2]MDU7200201.1 murein biosynthesis integral membrane protein MurJ [Enterobacteriaceae bacterium]PWF49953.1 murein biosynthesis integral membrane protein MurJ [[Kluyvera] intestini]SLJ91224.1 putative peptidoglycan lipid 